MHAITIELHVSSLDQAKNFYSQFGFLEEWRDDRLDSEYLVMSLKGFPLSFKLWNRPHSFFGQDEPVRGRGTEIVIAVDDIDLAYKQADRLQTVVTELQMRPWGVRDFRVCDPFGYYLRFTESSDVLSNDYQGRP